MPDPDIKLREIPLPIIERVGVPAPEMLSRIRSRQSKFYMDMRHAGVPEDSVNAVLSGYANLVGEIIGESKWWSRGRVAAGLTIRLINILRR